MPADRSQAAATCAGGREAYALAAGVLARTETKLRSAVTELGRSHSEPWRAEEKMAALGAWMLLRRYVIRRYDGT